MMLRQRASDVVQFLQDGVRDLPRNAEWVAEQARRLAALLRTRAAGLVSAGARTLPDTFSEMSKAELMELARKEDVSGRSSMTKAQLLAALRPGGKSPR